MKKYQIKSTPLNSLLMVMAINICPYCQPSDEFTEKGNYKSFNCLLRKTNLSEIEPDAPCSTTDWEDKCPLNPNVSYLRR